MDLLALTQSRSLTRSVAIAATLAVFVLYQFVYVAHFFVPLQIGGKNLYTIVPPVLVILAFVLLWPGIRRTPVTTSQALLLMALAFLWLNILYARTALFEDKLDILGKRYILLLFVFCAVLRYICRDPQMERRVGMLLVVVSVAQAIFGIVHYHFFPMIQLVAEQQDGDMYLSFEAELTREAGTLVSASGFAGVILCGQFVLLVERRIPLMLRALLMAVMAYAVTLSASRYPQVWSYLLLGGLFVNRRMDRTAPALLCVAALIGVLAFTGSWTSLFEPETFRFEEDSGGRLDKLVLAIELLGRDWLAPIIGVPLREIAAATTGSGLQVSDNSYDLIALEFGVPMLLLWLACLFAWIRLWPISLLSALMMGYFVGNLALTNSVLWDGWLFYFFAAWWVVHNRTPVLSGLKTESDRVITDVEPRARGEFA